ncbi:hypothetical protein [Pseudovibrio axinellae]|uniref:hypothetical protein n=1 Tax=Pseudovibrio axinellae TaxID=989403 RepID=UPI000943240C|nr:hypothetical protein [Pseudovibrio axinellae]
MRAGDCGLGRRNDDLNRVKSLCQFLSDWRAIIGTIARKLGNWVVNRVLSSTVLSALNFLFRVTKLKNQEQVNPAASGETASAQNPWHCRGAKPNTNLTCKQVSMARPKNFKGQAAALLRGANTLCGWVIMI